MVLSRVDEVFAQDLDELLAKSTPWALSSPSFGNPTIHDFVKGLILSTNIIELINKHIPNGIRADWGQVIDERDGNTFSKECDIVIYEGKPLKEIKNNCIKFVLVGKKQAKIVVQAKSSISSVNKEIKDYCKELKKFVPNVWFIAECCWGKSKNRSDTIKKELKKAGYSCSLFLKRKDAETFIERIEYRSFINFVKQIKRIK